MCSRILVCKSTLCRDFSRLPLYLALCQSSSHFLVFSVDLPLFPFVSVGSPIRKQFHVDGSALSLEETLRIHFPGSEKFGPALVAPSWLLQAMTPEKPLQRQQHQLWFLMGKPHSRTISPDPAGLCAHSPHSAWDSQSSNHSRGENSPPVVYLRATVYILAFLFYFFPIRLEPFVGEEDCVFAYFLVLYLCYLGVKVRGWRERVVFCVKSHTVLIRSPNLYCRKMSGVSVQWIRGF